MYLSMLALFLIQLKLSVLGCFPRENPSTAARYHIDDQIHGQAPHTTFAELVAQQHRVNASLACDSKCHQKATKKESSFKRSTNFDVLPDKMSAAQNLYRTKRATPTRQCVNNLCVKVFPSIAATAVNIDIASLFAHNKAVATVFLFVDPST